MRFLSLEKLRRFTSWIKSIGAIISYLRES